VALCVDPCFRVYHTSLNFWAKLRFRKPFLLDLIFCALLLKNNFCLLYKIVKHARCKICMLSLNICEDLKVIMRKIHYYFPKKN
jgi:hypothetical protein